MTPQQKYKAANKEKVRQQHKEYCERNKEKLKETRKTYAQSERGKEVRRKAHIKYLYKVTPEEYDELLLKQDNVCALCLKPESIVGNVLCIDHCHTTGRVRGLLCRLCNSALGKFKDDKEILQRALNYLEND